MKELFNCGKKSGINVYAFVLAVLLTLMGIANAQEAPMFDKDYKAKTDDLWFIISPYAMLASQATDVGTTQLRQSFGDLSSLTNFGFQLAGSVIYKNWFLSADGTYANLGTNKASGPLTVNLNIRQYILDLRLGYLLLNRDDYRKKAKFLNGWYLELNAGAKYWRNDVTLDYSITLNDPPPLIEDQIKNNQYWWDPMIGVKGRVFLNQSVMLGINAGYGGFGIGSASKYTWDFLFSNTFKVSKLILITTGFRAFKYKRSDPGDEGEIETKVTVAGPVLGMSFIL